MKNLLIACVLMIALSSCGGKLYSYRKTVKVKSTEASNKNYNGTTRAYFTIVSAPAAANTTNAANTTASAAPVNVTPNTVYLTTKPVDEEKKEDEQKKKLTSTQTTSSAMVR